MFVVESPQIFLFALGERKRGGVLAWAHLGATPGVNASARQVGGDQGGALDLEKAEEPEIKLPASAGSSKKQENARKNIYFCFVDYAKAFVCVDHNKLWKILKEMGIPDHLTCLLRNLYTGQEAIELDMEQQSGSE